MRTDFSTNWKASTQPRKQRKYQANAPAHLASRQFNVHLSRELREKHKRRSIRVRVGDTVKVLRGSHKGAETKVERVDVARGKLFLAKMERAKREGGVVKIPFTPSNLMIVTLNLDDKRRAKRLTKEAS